MARQIISVNKGIKEDLLKRLHTVSSEKDVETHWQTLFNTFLSRNFHTDGVVTTPLNTDGYVNIEVGGGKKLILLMEFKYDLDLNKSLDRKRVVAQLIHYMYRIKDSEYELPNILVGADNNQAFVLYAPNLYRYLEGSYNWGIAPSSAYLNDRELMDDLDKDRNMNTWVYTFNNRAKKDNMDNIDALMNEIMYYAIQGNSHEVFTLDITPKNIDYMYQLFNKEGLSGKEEKRMKSIDKVNLFMQLLGDSNENYYLHPKNPNKVIANNQEVEVDGAYISALFKKYNRDISPKDRDELNEIADRLMEDSERRFTGDFWTPTIWANRSDEMLREVLGDEYKQDTIVWDMASGSSNLTRDFYYNDLYVSTLHHSELEIGSQYNLEAREKFQYDFLNDDIDMNPDSDPDTLKIPTSLFNALKDAGKTGKRVLFYTNPPYGTSANNAHKGKKSKNNMSNTLVNTWMKKEGYGQASQQLYAQFFARVQKIVKDFDLGNVFIGFYTKTTHFSGGSYWNNFNARFLGEYKHVKGNLFNAEEFGGASNKWGVTFSIYEKHDGEVDNIYKFNIEESVFGNGEGKVIEGVGEKAIRLIPNDQTLTSWVNASLGEEVVEDVTECSPLVNNALGLGKRENSLGRFYRGSLGYHFAVGDNVGNNQQYIGLFTSAYRSGHGTNISDGDNFNRSVLSFSSRRSVPITWYNDKDKFSEPDEDTINNNRDLWSEFVNDALIFSLYDNQSYQASYRGTSSYNPDWADYSNTGIRGKWVNEWFWMSKDEVLELANDNNLQDVYNDARTDTDRYIYREIQKREFSPEALRVLNLARELVKETMYGRKLLIDDKPELHLRAWDAGWYQIKQIIKEVPTDEVIALKVEFDEALKVLRSKIEEGVYYFGMLVR